MTLPLNDNTQPHSLSPPPQLWDRLFSLATGARMLVWGLLFGILYLFSSFFALIFLTFVFSYIQASGVNRLGAYIKNRTLRVILVTTVFLMAIIAISLFLAPRVATQAKGFIGQFTTYLQIVDEEILALGNKYPPLYEVIPKLKNFQNKEGKSDIKKWRPEQSPTITLVGQFLGLGEDPLGQKFLKLLLDNLANIGTSVAAIIVSIIATFLLAFLFSFLIVLDLPRISANIAELKHTKLRLIYLEVADSIYDFSSVLGQAFEAQFLIAILNATLTALGVIYLLDLEEHVAFLSVIVFLTSFIPIAGVFISSIPICLIALQASGFKLMFLGIALITIIHMIEAYILNPQIYGHRLRMNPVIVLIILTIGGKLFHFWGLILGVPLFTYFFGHAIRLKQAQ
jgi:predicted PurR-regulated permease PerM